MTDQPSDRAREGAALVRLLRKLAPDDGTCALRMKRTEDAFTVNRAIREAADMIERETPGFAAGVEALEQEITAWAFAYNELMRRCCALTPAPAADYLTRAHAQIASGQSQENTVLDGPAPPASEVKANSGGLADRVGTSADHHPPAEQCAENANCSDATFSDRNKVMRACMDPGAFVGPCLQASDGSYEHMDHWRARAVIEACAGISATDTYFVNVAADLLARSRQRMTPR